MHSGLKALLISLMLSFTASSLIAQHSFSFNNGAIMSKFQDTLIRLSKETYEAQEPEVKLAKNAVFIKTLVNSLKTHTSFYYPFDSLKTISIIKSPDNSFKVFSWSVQLNNGVYRFFGAIQMATKDGSLKLYPLIDGTDNIGDVNTITSNKNWFGARYYEIVPVIISGKQPYYVMLGWKGNSDKTTKKVIEVLSFEKNEPVLGKSIFEGVKAGNSKNRIVFEYNKLNSMTLTMDKSINMIVFDHLAPFSEDMTGNFEYYASDLSFDGYKIINGRLKLVENVELKNDPNYMDDFYTDPTDKTTKPIKKL
ncbi:MAG: hypothetical protein EOO92_08880 [Pedobacter sp.]|nr:MAG: hypothetical protein EOO92_08880 [Pedobacter sp.]